MEDEKGINKKKKKPKKKKNSTVQEKALSSNSDQASVNQAQHDQCISPATDMTGGSLISVVSAESLADLPDKTSEQYLSLEPRKSILEDTNLFDLSKCTEKNEVLPNCTQDFHRDESNGLVDLKESNETQASPHSISQHKVDLVRSSAIQSGISILDTELNSMASEFVSQKANNSDLGNGKSISSAVTLIEEIENTHIDDLFADTSRDWSVDHLKLCLKKELKTSRLLRLQISTFEELVAMREADEVKSKAQIRQLKAENEHLENEVLKLKDMVKTLMHDRTQLLGMVAIQGDKLLPNELEASLGGPPFNAPFVNEHELGTTKEESMFVSPDDFLAGQVMSEPFPQDAVEASNVNTLVPEGSGVIYQEQHDLLEEDQGTGMSSPVEQLQTAEMPSRVMTESTYDIQLKSVSLVSDPTAVDLLADIRMTGSDTKKEIESDSLTEIKDIVENENVSDLKKELNAQVPNDLHSKVSPLEKYQHKEIPNEVHLSDSPLIGAPFRLVSFMARYVSGADLAAKNAR